MSTSTQTSGHLTTAPITPADPNIARRILENVTQLTPRLRERAYDTERRGRVLDESIQDLIGTGVFKMVIPVEYGGYALRPSQLWPVFAEIARGCGSTGWVAWLTSTGVHPVTIFSHRFQAELFAPGWDGPLQSGAISNFSPGVGRRVPGGLMIKGKWGWVSGCHHTRFHIVSVMVDADDGGKVSMTCQVPHEQIEIIDDWNVMGMQGSGSNTVTIREEVFVPDHRIVKTLDLFSGVRAAPAPAGLLYKVSFAQLGPLTIASLGLGLARAALEEFQKKANGRAITFTAYTDQLKAPVTHLQLGEMWAKLNACEAVIHRLAETIEAGAEQNTPLTPLSISKGRATAAYACVLAKEISDLALRASGASSIHASNPLQRIMRDATTVSMHAQTNVETAYEEIGRVMAGVPGMIGSRPKPDA